jgi:hypothetical protein
MRRKSFHRRNRVYDYVKAFVSIPDYHSDEGLACPILRGLIERMWCGHLFSLTDQLPTEALVRLIKVFAVKRIQLSCIEYR